MILNHKTKRIIVYIVGLFILALGLTLNTKANLGVSPIISVPYSISQITGLNFGDLTFIEYALFVFIEVLIHISEKNKKRITEYGKNVLFTCRMASAKLYPINVASC